MANSTARMRSGFTFYRSFSDAIRLLNSRDQLMLFHAIADYALDQQQPDIDKFSKTARICWVTILPNLDANIARYNNGCKPKSAAAEAKHKRNRSKQQADSITDDNDNVNDHDNDKESCKRARARSSFVIPTFEQVAEYIAVNTLDADAAQFIDHYTANGWRVGRTPMRDWQAALRNWARRDYTTNSQKQPDNESHTIYQAL